MPRPGRLLFDYLAAVPLNLLEPRCWDDGSGPEDPDAPDAFRGTLLSQHISFLRDVFRVYKGFDTPHIDTLELMVERLYQKWNITDRTDFASMQPTDYPILSDLYDAIQESYDHYEAADSLYPREMLRDLLLGLHSCAAARTPGFLTVIPTLQTPNSSSFVSRDWITWRKTCGTPCCSVCCPICRISF